MSFHPRRPTHELCACLLAVLIANSCPAQTVESAAGLYDRGCAACHGGDGRGLSPSQLGFDIALPDFTDCDFAVREPDSDWVAIVHGGGPNRGFDRMMPAFGEALTDAQIEGVVEHLRSFCSDDEWPRGELNLPRALFTEKAFPEDEAVITTTLVTEGNDSLTHKFLWEQRFGPRNQIEISLPLSRADLGAPRDWETGAGDLGLGVKRALRHDVARGSILSVGAEVVLPTGDEARGFGKGTTVWEAYVAFGKILPGDAFVQVQAKAEFPVEAGFENELVLRTALGRTFTSGGRFGRAWTPMLEVLAAQERHDKTQWDVVPQFQVTLSTRQHIMANFGARLPVNERSARETEWVFYLLWDWFDGGVLEGW
jgi:hypothetical protein